MYGKLVDDVREQQVAMVSCGGIDTVLDQETRPSERHQTSQLEALRFVVIVDVRTGLLDKQTGELKEGNPYAVRKRNGHIRIDKLKKKCIRENF